MPIACRFLVMICSEATQSDQPEITWIWNETGLPFGSISLLPLYVKPLCGQQLLRRRPGCRSRARLAWALIAGSVTQDGKIPFRPIASVGGA